MPVRRFIAVLLLLACAQAASASDSLKARVDESLAGAGKLLITKQSDDGAWRSTRYASFRDGSALTAHVLSTLSFIVTDETSRAHYERGRDFLIELRADRTHELTYPVYCASEISWVLGLGADSIAAHARRVFWLDYLRDRQLNSKNGWNEDDSEFGGWGYCPFLPLKPKPGGSAPPQLGSNLSATVFALGAFRSARVAVDDPVYGDALKFIERCQNFGDDPEFDDGGFFFSPTDEAGNKPGVAGVDARGSKRYRSYGSMTADGIRALLVCGLPRDHPRIIAGRKWLEGNFDASHNPGDFQRDRRVLRDAAYYYWCWSVAHAFARLDVRELDSPSGKIDWASALAEELLRRQHEDGSWSNDFTDSREDEPLVATPFAAAALAICRERLR